MSDYHRIHNVLKDNDEFHCSGHEYIQVSKKEYDKVCLNHHVFQPDRRLADSPTVGTAAFSNIKGAQDEASLDKICNTKRFTAELLEGHRDLKRRITSPKLDTGDPFENSSLKRRATTPFPRVQEFQEWTVSHHLKEAQQPTAAEATSAEEATSYGTLSLTQELDALAPSQENAAEPSVSGKPKLTASIPNINHGRLVLLALSIAESIFPGFEDAFIIARLERGDLADYSLELDMDSAVLG